MGWRFPLTTVGIAGASMEPTLAAGDVCIVLRTRKVKPGQIVVAEHPERPGFWLVKRALRREPGGWWLVGDNTAASDDSRTFGALPESLIIGRVLWTRRTPSHPG